METGECKSTLYTFAILLEKHYNETDTHNKYGDINMIYMKTKEIKRKRIVL